MLNLFPLRTLCKLWIFHRFRGGSSLSSGLSAAGSATQDHGFAGSVKSREERGQGERNYTLAFKSRNRLTARTIRRRKVAQRTRSLRKLRRRALQRLLQRRHPRRMQTRRIHPKVAAAPSNASVKAPKAPRAMRNQQPPKVPAPLNTSVPPLSVQALHRRMLLSPLPLLQLPPVVRAPSSGWPPGTLRQL